MPCDPADRHGAVRLLRVKHRPLLLGVVALTILSACNGSGGQTARQADVEARGAKVMPFDQTRTTHIFRKTSDGGVQSVVAKHADDSRQIRLVREHLRKEAIAFARGDFTDPMAIHGMQMPGIGTLRAGASRIDVTYAAMPR